MTTSRDDPVFVPCCARLPEKYGTSSRIEFIHTTKHGCSNNARVVGESGYKDKMQRNREQHQQSSCTRLGTFVKSTIGEPFENLKYRHGHTPRLIKEEIGLVKRATGFLLVPPMVFFVLFCFVCVRP